MTVPLVMSTFLDEESTRKALAGFIAGTDHLSMGARCRAFEEAFARYQGRRHSLLFNSGGSANLALLQALKNLERLKGGDDVGFSAVTWSTNVMPVIQMAMNPVPLDCSRRTLNTGSKELADALDEGALAAVFLTNALGFSGDIEALAEICRSRGILLLEDNCESLGSERKGVKLGNFGLASTFSFYVSHHISTIEGGMVCTDDDELASMLRLVRANGWDRNLDEAERAKLRKRHDVTDLDGRYTFYDLGFNLRPTEITGFLGLRQLEPLPASVRRRQANYERIAKAVAANDDFLPLDREGLSVLSAFAMPFVCRDETLRARYAARFEAAGVEIRPLIAGNIQKQPFYVRYVRCRRALPEADFLHRCAFYCGNHPDYDESQLSLLEGCIGGDAS